MLKLERQGNGFNQFFGPSFRGTLETTIKSRVRLLVRPILWHLLGLDELHK